MVGSHVLLVLISTSSSFALKGHRVEAETNSSIHRQVTRSAEGNPSGTQSYEGHWVSLSRKADNPAQLPSEPQAKAKRLADAKAPAQSVVRSAAKPAPAHNAAKPAENRPKSSESGSPAPEIGVDNTTSNAAPAGNVSNVSARAEKTANSTVEAVALQKSGLRVVAKSSDPIDGKNASSAPKCSSSLSNGHVRFFEDDEGTQRCFVIVLPIGVMRPVPLLFWFHASGGSAQDCLNASDDTTSLVNLAQEKGIGLICVEASQDIFGKGGQWAIPTSQTVSTGTRCDPEDSVDISYMRGVFRSVRQDYSALVDVQSIFLAGISMGGAFSEYMSMCMNKELGTEHVYAFASHSTGLKEKGDGLPFPRDIWKNNTVWAECADCGFFPFVPEKTNGTMKACLFDNTDDPTQSDPFFYKSTLNMKEKWEGLGNVAEVHEGVGGHMAIHSFSNIMACLDDGTGKLLYTGSWSVPMQRLSTFVASSLLVILLNVV